MKRNWSMDELIDHWTLTPTERQMVERAETASNQLGFAVLLKWFQSEGRFPARKQDVPSAAVFVSDNRWTGWQATMTNIVIKSNPNKRNDLLNVSVLLILIE